MSPRPPSDAAVALRSLPRRFRALFTGLGDDESPDALAHRAGPDGTTPIGHLGAAIRLLVDGGRSVEQILVSDDPRLEPLDGSALPAGSDAAGSLEERLAELATAAASLADRVDAVSAADWSRQGRLGTVAVTAADRLWEVVDSGVAALRAAETTLDESRRAH